MHDTGPLTLLMNLFAPPIALGAGLSLSLRPPERRIQ